MHSIDRTLITDRTCRAFKVAWFTDCERQITGCTRLYQEEHAAQSSPSLSHPYFYYPQSRLLTMIRRGSKRVCAMTCGLRAQRSTSKWVSCKLRSTPWRCEWRLNSNAPGSSRKAAIWGSLGRCLWPLTPRCAPEIYSKRHLCLQQLLLHCCPYLYEWAGNSLQLHSHWFSCPITIQESLLYYHIQSN